MMESIVGIIGSTLIGIGVIVFSWKVYQRDAEFGVFAFLISLFIEMFCLCAISEMVRCCI